MKRLLITSSISALLMFGSLAVSAQTAPASAPPAQQNHADANDKSKGQDLVGDTKPATANPVQAPPTVGQDKAAGNNLVGDNNGQMQNTAMPNPTDRPDFQKIDVNKHGYVTLAEVKTQPWVKNNFAKCDADHDGHLTQAEYSTCLK